MSRGRGRPRRETLPEGIGQEPDDVVAKREGVTRGAIRYLRETRGIPPADPMWAQRWRERKGEK